MVWKITKTKLVTVVWSAYNFICIFILKRKDHIGTGITFCLSKIDYEDVKEFNSYQRYWDFKYFIDHWVDDDLDNYFNYLLIPNDNNVVFVVNKLEDIPRNWWEGLQQSRIRISKPLICSWPLMVKLIISQYYLDCYYFFRFGSIPNGDEIIYCSYYEATRRKIN